MKKIIFTIVLFTGLFSSCTDKFDEYNTNGKQPTDVTGESLFSNAEKELADYISNTDASVNIYKLMAQYWTQTMDITESNYNLLAGNISGNIYAKIYLSILKDLNEAAVKINATEVPTTEKPVKKNKLAIIELITVFTYGHLVDIFGAVPYTEALDENNVYPKYDSGEDIYADLFTRLDAALDSLNNDAVNFGSADIYYGGKTESWIKFGNALKIKLAIITADANDSASKAAVEAAYSKTFTSNDDDCQLNYLDDYQSYNQLYAELVASGNHNYVPANTIIDTMNTLGDPRMAVYFSDKIVGQYIGGKYGYYNAYADCSHIGEVINEPSFPGFILTYSEVCFYLAEAYERGYFVGKSAEEWYNEGIKASFAKWDVTGVVAYLAKPEVAYTTATGTWKQKIGMQSWIANYVRGDVAYNNWRRLDYPILNLPEEVSSYEDIPVRFTFPVNEQTLNTVEYNNIVTLIGGDKVTSKIFWDKN
jgi:hypothetical protein